MQTCNNTTTSYRFWRGDHLACFYRAKWSRGPIVYPEIVGHVLSSYFLWANMTSSIFCTLKLLGVINFSTAFTVLNDFGLSGRLPTIWSCGMYACAYVLKYVCAYVPVKLCYVCMYLSCVMKNLHKHRVNMMNLHKPFNQREGDTRNNSPNCPGRDDGTGPLHDGIVLFRSVPLHPNLVG